MSYTELETVNYIISQTGAAPVDNLTDFLPDIQSALLRMDEAIVSTLKRGWWFNTDYNVEILSDVNDKFPIPTETIKILRASPSFLIDRGGFAYDPYTQTDTFTGVMDTICVTLVMKLPYESLPYSAQDVVRAAAARSHVILELEDVRKAELLNDELTLAVAEMKKDDLEIKRRSVRQNPTFRRVRGRVRPYHFSGSNNPNYPGG